MTNVKISNLPPAIAISGNELLEIDQGGTSKRATASQISKTFLNAVPASAEYFISAGGAPVQPGVYGYLAIPFECTITGAEAICDAEGDTSIDIWRCSYVQFDAGATHPVASDSITSNNPITVTASTKTQSDISGWQTGISNGDILAFSVGTTTNMTRITIILTLLRSL